MNTTLQRLSGGSGAGGAGILPRLGALILDWLAIGLGLCVIATAGFALTRGEIRMASPPLQYTSCSVLPRPPSGFDPDMTIPGVDPALQRRLLGDTSTFAPTAFEECRTVLFGLETDRKATIAEESGQLRYFIVPVDPEGRVTQPLLYLDHLFGPLMFLLLFLSEAFWGRTPGKAVAGLRVTDREGRPAGVRRALIRNAIIWGPGALLGLFNMLAYYGLTFAPMSLTGFTAGLWAVLIAFVLWPIGLMIALLVSNRSPFWDRLAGTRVA